MNAAPTGPNHSGAPALGGTAASSPTKPREPSEETLQPHERVMLAEYRLVTSARRLARANGLTDVAGLLGGASGLASAMAHEENLR